MLSLWLESLGARGEAVAAAASILRAPHGCYCTGGRGALRLQYACTSTSKEHKRSIRASTHKRMHPHQVYGNKRAFALIDVVTVIYIVLTHTHISALSLTEAAVVYAVPVQTMLVIGSCPVLNFAPDMDALMGRAAPPPDLSKPSSVCSYLTFMLYNL